jgi:hypothetical protein
MSSDEFDFSEDDQSRKSPSRSDTSIDPSDDDSFREENDHPNKKIKRTSAKTSTKRPPAKPKSNAKKSHKAHQYSDEDSHFDEMDLDDIHRDKGGKKTIEETYQKMTPLEHILLRPDTYIGSVEPLTQQMFVVVSNEKGQPPTIQQREITYTPGLFKIFDEILVNAADNKQRDPNMDRLEIVLEEDGEDAVISVWNNGRGIPVEWHKEEDCYVPTLIFGDLLTVSICFMLVQKLVLICLLV